MTLKSDLDRRAKALIDASAAAEPIVPLETQVDVFKAVAAYYLGTQRGTRAPPPPDGAPTFTDLVGKLGKHTQAEGNA